MLTSEEGMEPKLLVRRAEKLLNLAENIAMRAEASDDNRLCLMALDRAQRSLDSLLKVAGLIGPDSVTLIDARTQISYEKWPSWAIEAVLAFYGALERGESLDAAIEAVKGKTPQALSPGRQEDA